MSSGALMRARLKESVLCAVCITGAAVAVALLFNALNSQGLPLSYEKAKPILERSTVAVSEYPDIEKVDLKETKKAFDAKSSIFVDARSVEVYYLGHIPGALSLPTQTFAERLEKLRSKLPKEASIIAYCSGIGCASSLKVAGELKRTGYTNVRAFVGGWGEWTAAKYPVAVTPPSLIPKVRLTVASASEVRTAVAQKTGLVVDTRPRAQASRHPIEGAVLLPKDDFTGYYPAASSKLRPPQRVRLYLYGGDRSVGEIARRLTELGYKNLRRIGRDWRPAAAASPSAKATAEEAMTGPVLPGPAKSAKQPTRPASSPAKVQVEVSGTAAAPGPTDTVPVEVMRLGLAVATSAQESGSATFVDARSKEDYDKGHIPGALSLPLEQFDEYFPQVVGSFSPGRLIIVYCDGKKCNSSVELAEKIAAAGFTNVAAFVDGWESWLKAGLPVSTASAS